jgi:hypothetical protein
MRHALVALILAGCAANAADTRPSSPSANDVTIVNASAAAGSGLVATPLEVPFERGRTGAAAREVFTRAAAAKGAHYVSDLEFHLAVQDHGDYECVVHLQTIPRDAELPAAPADAITTRLMREVTEEWRGYDRYRPVEREPYYAATVPANTGSAQQQIRTAAPVPGTRIVMALPYWAADAEFLPAFFDRAHPPESGKWKLAVSEPRCHEVVEPLPGHFVRGTIYLPPAGDAAK